MKACRECEYEYPDKMLASMEMEDHSVLENMCPLCAYRNHINPARGLPPDTPPGFHAPQALGLYMAAKAFREGQLPAVEYESIKVITVEEEDDDTDDDGEVLGTRVISSFMYALNEMLKERERDPSKGGGRILEDFTRTCLSHEALRHKNQKLMDALLAVGARGPAESLWALAVLDTAYPGVAKEANERARQKARPVTKH